MKRLLLALLLCLPVTLLAQDKSIPQEITYDHLSALYGVTFCTAKGVYSYVNLNLPSPQDSMTRAHEAKHQEQFKRFTTCEAWQKYYNTPAGLLAAESEAFMAGWCVAVKAGMDGDTLLQKFAEIIEHLLGGEINRLVVLQEMQKYRRCGG